MSSHPLPVPPPRAPPRPSHSPSHSRHLSASGAPPTPVSPPNVPQFIGFQPAPPSASPSGRLSASPAPPSSSPSSFASPPQASPPFSPPPLSAPPHNPQFTWPDAGANSGRVSWSDIRSGRYVPRVEIPRPPPVKRPALEPLAASALHDRILGALLGSATANAIGVYTDGITAPQARAAYPAPITLCPPTRFHRRRRRRLGDWAATTEQALLVLLSFLHNGESTPSDLARRLRSWTQQGLRVLDTVPRDFGGTISAAVAHPLFLKNPFQAAYEVWAGSGRRGAASASLTRTYPLALAGVFDDEVKVMDTAARLSCVTHVDPRCVVACMIAAALLRRLLLLEATRPEHIDEVVAAAADLYRGVVRPALETRGPFSPNDPPLDVAELRRYTRAGNLAVLELDGPAGSYVYRTLGAGLVTLRTAMARVAAAPTPAMRVRVFEPLISELVLMGGDANTNASFAGALLGAYAGFGALPAHWVDGLTHGPWLMGKGESLCRLLGVAEGEYDGLEDRETYEDGGKGFLTPQEIRKRLEEASGGRGGERMDVSEEPEATLFFGQGRP